MNRSHVGASFDTASETLELLPSFGLDDLSRVEEHRVHVVDVHLLQLGVVELLRDLGVVDCVLPVDGVLHRVVALGNAIDSSTWAILDADERTDGSHRTHGRHHRLVFALRLVDVLLVLHHLVAVLPTRLARGDASDVFGNRHVEVLLLLLIDVAPLHALGRH